MGYARQEFEEVLKMSRKQKIGGTACKADILSLTEVHGVAGKVV